MLDKLKSLFATTTASDEKHLAPSIELACAALLIELIYADYNKDPAEISAAKEALQQTFALQDAELQELIELAETEKHEAVSMYPFTSVINERFEAQEKIQIIAMLWQVAYADGHLDKFEEHYIRKIADLLYVSHKDFIQAKLKATKQA